MDDIKDKDADLMQEIRNRWEEAEGVWQEAYAAALEDLRFANGKQWPDDIESQRIADGRPCLTINKTASFGDQLIGDIRMNEPSIKVKPVDSGSDPDVAEILTGLMRNIEVQSNAEVAYDSAAESAIWCGFGAFRVITDYLDDESFEQDIRIKRIKNPFQVMWDPMSTEWDRSDARYCIIYENVPRDEFMGRWPDAQPISADGKRDNLNGWCTTKSVRICEYFRKVAEDKTLYLLRSDETGAEFIDTAHREGTTVVKKRQVEAHKIEHYKVNGQEILEGPDEWPGTLIPICSVFGKEMNIEGNSIYRGIVRNAKDPARLYNYSRSQHAELTALAPKVPFLATMKMIGNYQSIWDTAHKKSLPVLPFDVDPELPAFPKRAEPVSQNTGILAEIQIADQELHDTTGLQQANLGKTSNEKSGRAVLARQREGDVANFAYYDNLARAITYCGKVLLDLIPRIYDTERVVRILGEGDKEQFVPINQPVQLQQQNGEIIQKVFDLTIGKYDVVVTVGPSYSTQRDEAVDSMMAFVKAVPSAGPVVGDLVAKNMDWPGAQEIGDRLKRLIPPQILGEQPAQQQQQPPPDPKEMLDLKKKKLDIEGKEISNTQSKINLHESMRSRE